MNALHKRSTDLSIYSKDSVKSLNLSMPATKRVVAVARGLVTAAI